jgi:hypothetical protein
VTFVLDDHQVEQRKAAVAPKLEDLGDLTVSDVPRARHRRLIEQRAGAPGADLPELARFEYREVFERRGNAWQLLAYAHEFLANGGRRAYHWHDGSFHAHCVGPGARAGRHYRAVPMDAFEAHDELARIYLSGAQIRCDDLRPMLAWSEATIRDLCLGSRYVRSVEELARLCHRWKSWLVYSIGGRLGSSICGSG